MLVALRNICSSKMIIILSSIICASYLLTVNGIFRYCDTGFLIGSECIEIPKCKEFNYDFHSIERQNFIRSRHCGFDGDKQKICCFTKKFQSKMFTFNSVEDCGINSGNKTLKTDDELLDIKEFPWLALLQYKSFSASELKIGCGGVLINNRYVLTSAFCLTANYKLVSVRLGEYITKQSLENYNTDNSYKKESIVIDIEEKIQQDNYKSSLVSSRSYDIALLRLKRQVIENYIKPICLPPYDTRIWLEETYFTAGWGAVPWNIFSKSDKKGISKLNIVDKNICQFGFDKSIPMDDRICTLGYSFKKICFGDYGGPLMSIDNHGRFMVEGIFTPIGYEPCSAKWMPGIYTDVRKYRDWIIGHLRD